MMLKQRMGDRFDLAEESARQEYLDWLYQQDGRHLPGHPARGCYSGLVMSRQKALLAADRADLLRSLG